MINRPMWLKLGQRESCVTDFPQAHREFLAYLHATPTERLLATDGELAYLPQRQWRVGKGGIYDDGPFCEGIVWRPSPLNL